MEMANGDYVVDDRSSSGIAGSYAAAHDEAQAFCQHKSAVARGFHVIWDGTITTIFIFNIVHY
jgi:hypothetical protein